MTINADNFRLRRIPRPRIPGPYPRTPGLDQGYFVERTTGLEPTIGPERLWDPPIPAGGFKDGQCRVKRQAARFRLYAYNDDGTIDEITAAEADISWTVHLVNKKAVTRNSGSAADLTIDPGPRTLTGPDQRAEFDTGTITFPGTSAVTVPLGEIRTDDEGHLLVLGGFGHVRVANELADHQFPRQPRLVRRHVRRSRDRAREDRVDRRQVRCDRRLGDRRAP